MFSGSCGTMEALHKSIPNTDELQQILIKNFIVVKMAHLLQNHPFYCRLKHVAFTRGCINSRINTCEDWPTDYPTEIIGGFNKGTSELQNQ